MSSKTFRVNLNSDLKRERRKELLLGVLVGLMLGFAFPPIPLYPLIFLAFIPYFKVLENRDSLASINRFTYLSVFIYGVITLYWVGSWQSESDPFLMIAGVALLFYYPVLYLIPSSLYYMAYKKYGRRIALFLFPLFWAFTEFLYSITDFKFPWVTLGHSLAYFKSFIQISDIIGSFGLGILVIYINVFFYLAYKNYIHRKKYLAPIFIAFVLIILPMIYGVVRVSTLDPQNDSISIGVVQPDLNPWKKWEAGNLDQQLDQYLAPSSKEVENGAKLIVWPETALPVYLLGGGYERIVNRIHTFCDTNNVYIMTGMPYASYYFDSTKAPVEAKKTKSGTYYTSYNSILLFQPNKQDVPMYGKIKLVPFGEKVPFVESIPFFGDVFKWNVGISSWNEGTEQKVFEIETEDGIHKIAGVVCIESIYPKFISGFVKKGAELIIVVTNDSWYGDLSGPYQHRDISVLRAIENRRTVIQAANGGISYVIDKYGNTLIDTKMLIKTSFMYNVELSSESTIYASTTYVLPAISILTSLFIMLVSIIEKTKKKKK